MALAKDMMGGGVSAGMAKAINGNRNSAVSAAGTTQVTATELAVTNNWVSTVAANAGVRLFNASHGDDQWVYNAGANTLTVYPPVGSKINQIATNGGMSLGTNTGVIIRKMTDTQWMANLSA